MAVRTNQITTNEITTSPREVDFVSVFTDNWTALMDILGVTNMIKKAPGTQLVSYKAKLSGSLAGGTNVAEGEIIPLNKFEVEPVSYSDIEIAKYGKSVSVEAIAKYGADVAIDKTDSQFRTELQNGILSSFYTFLNGGTLTGTQKTWQRAMAIAKGAVLNKFASMNKSVTDVVAFANIMDLYDYLGDTAISVQSAFGVQYVKDFLGYSTVILLPDNYIARNTVIACPVENIDCYYIDPSDSAFAKGGLQYTVDGETNLIGYHVMGNYERAASDSYALMGIKLWAEYLDGIAVVTVGSSNTDPTVKTPSQSAS